ncbi:zinc finger protein 271-like [Wyeomyia smithii]|uniref:zinc finger protein 271-like n=1 Tax=Wyeomyia smithii TaxID=174621 RepID=UPI002467D734|nr:zinc finger protein 271-like [Wyeomyia smithii]XP_055532705.1 zinc finger protein 271-like [Wyeomyia smithii]
MLLRQVISASNAIEEIYIVKREDESDEDNPPVCQLLPETGAVPVAMVSSMIKANTQTATEEIKSEPDDDQCSIADLSVQMSATIATNSDENCGVKAIEIDTQILNTIKSEDEDDIPLAARMRKRKSNKIRQKNDSCRRNADTDMSDSNGEYKIDDNGKPNCNELKCNICLLNFTTRTLLKHHLQKNHFGMLPFSCAQCVPSEARSLCSLNRHFGMHDSTKPHKCYYCEARFSLRIYRTAHQRRFHKEDLENDTIRNANRRFICRYCNKRFAAKYNLERHERNHEMKITNDESFLNRRNKCFLCDSKPCDTKEALHTHLSIHVDKLPYSCELCEDTSIITSIRLLNKHLASHEESEKPIKCVYCNERFISVGACQAHERTHAQEKQADEVAVAKIESERISTKIIIVDGMKRYECGYCGNSYSLLSTLRRHENIHTGKIQYICKVCGKIFNKSSCLLQHERTHLQDAPYKCEICGRGFKETIRLIEHRRIHSGERPFACQFCFQSFRIKPLLKEHTMQCNSPKLNMECKCRFCNAIFDGYHDFQDHVLKDHPAIIEETQCDFCDLRFKSAMHLVEHEYNHRNPNSIKCGICGRIFKQLSNLRRHQRLHSNDAIPFQCDLCGKSFSQSGALKVHKRIHSGEKPYKCDLCDKTFYHSSTMNRHKRSHYRTKSRLFLFGDQLRLSINQLEKKPTDTKAVPVALMHHSQMIADQVFGMAESNDLIDFSPTTISMTNEKKRFSQSQVPGNSSHHKMVIGSFEINTKNTENRSTTEPESVHNYALSSELLIPQTILQHQEQACITNDSNSTGLNIIR